MADIKNLKDLEKHLKDNPEIIFKQNIGKKIKKECPTCTTIQDFEILSKDRIKCLGCKEEFNIEVIIK